MGSTASIAMAFLKDQLVAVEIEKKRLDAEAQAINLLLEKHGGASQRSLEVSHRTVYTVPPNTGVQLSISKLVHKALSEAGKPQTTAQLLAFLASHGRTVKNSTLRTVIHQGKLFRSVEPGLYGLKE